jgi:pimeloyl-ACP methyl ester carboxylesterase
MTGSVYTGTARVDVVDNAVVRAASRTFLAFLLVFALACGRGTQTTGKPSSGVRERNVTFTTADGTRLTGRLFGQSRVGVTLAHMFPADARSWYPAARRIAKAGYMTLAFNFRGYLGSQGPKQIAKAPTDLAAAAKFLESSGAHDIAFVGASMGGTASIIEAETLNPLAVVTVSAPLNFMGLDATLIANRVQRPVLLIAARGDTSAFHDLQRYERSLPNPDGRIFGGDAHGTALLDARPEAIGEIITFLKRYAPLKRSVTTTAKP